MEFFNAMHMSEAQIIQNLQQLLGTGLRIPMLVISFFASAGFVIPIIPLVYWCINRRKGVEFGLLVLLSTFINLWLKELFAWPRPYQFIQSIGLAKESTYGLPSGHSQLSVLLCAFMTPFLPKKWRLPILIFVPLLIGFSRIYLGVHFISDVLSGYLVGAVIFLLFKIASPWIEKVLQKSEFRVQIIIIAALSFFMNVLFPRDTTISGAFLGAAIGFAFASRNVPLSYGDSATSKAIRYFVGLASAGAVYYLCKLASNPLEAISGNTQERLVRFARYAVLGGWMSYGAPFLFIKLKIAKRES